MKIVRNLIISVVVLVLIGLGAAYFSLNSLIKKGFETVGPKVAKVETRLGSAAVFPFTGSGKLSQIFIGNPEGSKTPHAITLDAINVQVNLPSIKTDTILVSSVKIVAPDIYIEGGLTSKNNLTTIAKNIESTLSSPEPKAAQSPKKSDGDSGKKVVIKDLLITGAKVHWVSVLTLGQEVALPLPDIHLQNIGEKSNGLTPVELSKLILDEIFKAASTVSSKNTGKMVEQLKEQGKEKLNKAAGGLKGLLNK